jgi:LysR family glycine cleavage system transcriptional activator
MDVQLFPVCSPSYLAKFGPFSDISDLARVVLLRHTMEPWDGWLGAVGQGQAGKSIIPAGPLYTDARLMLQAACDGHGVALARDVLAEKDISAGRLVRLFELHVQSEQGYYAFFRPGSMSRPAISMFVDWLVETCCRLQSRPRTLSI